MRLLSLPLLSLLLLTACGGSKASTSPPPATRPTLDCEPVVAKIVECLDAFESAYATTPEAGQRGRASQDSPPDGAAGAKRLMTAFRHEHNRVHGLEYCQTSWATRDPAWRERLMVCDLDQPCEAWSRCAADAIGTPMTPGYGTE